MNSPLKPFAERKRMTRLGEAVARALRAGRKAIIDDQDIWPILEQIYGQRSVAYLRGQAPTADTVTRIKALLRVERIISRDPDYTRMWRVNELPDVPADEAVCMVDRGTCISHLSAMQVFNLTDRRPIHLYVTLANAEAWREIVQNEASYRPREKLPLRHHHPSVVRSRQLIQMVRSDFPPTTKIRNSWIRVTDIGQTFVDMLESPDHCGGMSHVLDAYQKRAKPYLDQIVTSVDNSPNAITKVRAGYILEEMLGLRHRAIEKWATLAQRGGSRKLDPKSDYAPTFSEKWMISLNV